MLWFVLLAMAKEVRSAPSFDDMAEEHDTFDVELGESSHDDQNFDAELAETDQPDTLGGNDDSTVDDPVCCSSCNTVILLPFAVDVTMC